MTEENSVQEGQPATSEGQEGQEPQLDTIDKVREWGKGWETSAKSYEPAHKFVSERFGNLEQAQLSAEVFDKLFGGESFDPDEFLKTISSVSPKRSNVLLEHFAKTKAQDYVPKELEAMFGKVPTKEEISLFREWQKSGMFGKGDDLPEYLRFDKDGNPRSEEEIKFFMELKKSADEGRTFREQEQAEKKAREESERQQEIEKQTQEFGVNRIAVLESEFKTYGLDLKPEDTEEVRTEKTMLRKFISDGVASLFLADKNGAEWYQTALAHIEDGEPLLAKRYETKIEAKLLEIFRSKPLERILNALKVEQVPEPKKDSFSTVIQGEQSKQEKLPPRFDVRAAVKNLFDTGQIKE